MTARPAARSALARADAAIVADSRKWAMLADGTNVNQWMIDNHYAVVYFPA